MNLLKPLLKSDLVSALASKTLMSKMKKLSKSETGACYIFGNGSSLKYLDLSKFSDLPAIGCNLLCLHSHVGELNLRYYTFLDPMYSMGSQSREFLNRFKDFIRCSKNTTFLVSPYDLFKIRLPNVSFLAPLSDNWPGNDNQELARMLRRSNNPLVGSLRAQILLAIFLGFEKLILVGHDYTLTPTKSGHFYENEIDSTFDLSGWNKEFLHEISKLVEIVSLGINSDSSVVKYEEVPDSKRLPTLPNAKIPISSEDYLLLQVLNEDKSLGFNI